MQPPKLLAFQDVFRCLRCSLCIPLYARLSLGLFVFSYIGFQSFSFGFLSFTRFPSGLFPAFASLRFPVFVLAFLRLHFAMFCFFLYLDFRIGTSEPVPGKEISRRTRYSGQTYQIPASRSPPLKEMTVEMSKLMFLLFIWLS